MVIFDFTTITKTYGATLDVTKPRNFLADDVKEFRRRFRLSQSKLALIMNVTKKTVEKWEQGVNRVSGTTQMLFHIYENNPDLIRSIYKYENIEVIKETEEKETNDNASCIEDNITKDYHQVLSTL